MQDNHPFGPHSLLAALAAGALGPIFDHWLARYVVCAAIGLAFSLLADWLRPQVTRHGRRVAGEHPTDPPRAAPSPPESAPEPPHDPPEIPVEDDNE